MIADNSLHFDGLQPNQRAFLLAFRKCGVITKAAESIGMSRHAHYEWLTESEDYKTAFHSCRDSVCDLIEDSLVQRLIHGWQEPIFQGGVQVGTRTRFDNRAALRYLERICHAFKPEAIEGDERLDPADVAKELLAMREATSPGINRTNTER